LNSFGRKRAGRSIRSVKELLAVRKKGGRANLLAMRTMSRSPDAKERGTAAKEPV